MALGLVGLLGGFGALRAGSATAANLPPATTTSTTTSTTTTTPSPTDPTTSTTTTTSTPSTTTTSALAPGGPTTTIPPTPAMAAEQASVRRTGPSSTAPLLAALAPLARLGLSQEQIAILGFGQFPVAGPATYSDIFLEYRSWPEPHVHQGIDIDAADGTPLRSPADGTLTYSDSDPNGYGLTALVTQTDGTVYLLAHMSATVLGLVSGDQVTQGQVIGFVGETGDSTGPHLDFEVHPHGGPAIDAKPILDEFLAAAIAAAPHLVAEYEGQPASAMAPTPPVSVPASVPAATSPRPARDRPGAGRPIAMVSSDRSSLRLLLGLVAALALALVGSTVWSTRRRAGGGWTEP